MGYCYALDYTRERPHYDLEKIIDGVERRFVAFDRLGLKYYSVGAEQISVIDNVRA